MEARGATEKAAGGGQETWPWWCGYGIPHPYHVNPAKSFCDFFLLTFSQPYNEADEGSDLAQGFESGRDMGSHSPCWLCVGLRKQIFFSCTHIC